MSDTRVCVVNVQQEAPVALRRMAWLAQQVLRRLRITGPGTMAITFIDGRRMRRLNRQFLRHDRSTDVLSFRYDVGPGPRPQVIGEILIAPTMARRYARQHGLSYEEELSRYMVHGLLHWLGHEDATPAQQRAMRTREDRLLTRCGVKRWTESKF